jgi:hypothetical protein
MVPMLRSFTHAAAVFFFVATASGQILGQVVKDRELKPAFDFAQIQMPVEIVSIKVGGKEVQPGEKTEGDDNWLQGLSFTLKNISDKPIAYVDIGLRFLQPNGVVVVYSLHYGVDFSRGDRRKDSSPPTIQPGASFDLVLTEEKYKNFLDILARLGVSKSFDVAPYYVGRICFEDEPDLIWEGGNLKRRDPIVSPKFNVVERYVLPAKQR